MCNCKNEKEVYVNRTAGQVKKMLDLYFDGADNHKIYESISPKFPKYISEVAFEKKASLRDLFRKHPAWNEEMQAILVKGVDICVDPEKIYEEIRYLVIDICKMIDFTDLPCNKGSRYSDARFNYYEVRMFIESLYKGKGTDTYIDKVAELFDGVYHKGKKPSRMARALFEKLPKNKNFNSNVFEELFAQLSDIMNGKTNRKEDIFISINPAHILSQSNPKYEGGMLTSCHSLNSKEYEYSAGPTGYVNDDVTFIMFTIVDSNEFEKSYYRKTSRMFGHYKDGVLLTSRLYTSDGGRNSRIEANDVYRHIAQQAISTCIGMPNKWTFKKYDYIESDYKFNQGYGFGGYADWQYPGFTPDLSKLKNYDIGGAFRIGGEGICMGCLEPNDEYCLCEECMNCFKRCICCGESANETIEIDGDPVCASCFRGYYEECQGHRGWVHRENSMYIEGYGWYCRECVEELFSTCEECNELHKIDENIFYCLSLDKWICKDCGETLGLHLYKSVNLVNHIWCTDEELEHIKKKEAKKEEA